MNYIVTKPIKSRGIAIITVIILGGLGLFYSTIAGGIIMGIIAPILIIAFLIIGGFTGNIIIISSVILFCVLYYLICIIWAVKAVNKYNKRIEENSINYNHSNAIDKTLKASNTNLLLQRKNEFIQDLERIKSLYDQKIISQENYQKQNESLLYKIEIATHNYDVSTKLINTNEEIFENTNSIEKKRNNNLLWILSILLVASLIYLYYYESKKGFSFRRITTIFNNHEKDKEQIKLQIENTYFGISNGIYSSPNYNNIKAEELPFYNTDFETMFPVSLMPLATFFGGAKMETKNIDVYEFKDDDSANVRYNLLLKTSGDSLSIDIDMLVKKIGGKWKLDAKKLFGDSNILSNKKSLNKQKLKPKITIDNSELINEKTTVYKVTGLNKQAENGEYYFDKFNGDKSFIVSEKYVYEVDHKKLIGKWKIKEQIIDDVDIYIINTYEGVNFSLEDFIVKSSPTGESISYQNKSISYKQLNLNTEYINK